MPYMGSITRALMEDLAEMAGENKQDTIDRMAFLDLSPSEAVDRIKRKRTIRPILFPTLTVQT